MSRYGSLVPVGSVTTWLSGGTPDRANASYWAGSVPWISAATLKKTHVYDSRQRITKAAVRAGSMLAPQGATLILVRGMALHREVRLGLTMRPVSFNQDVKALVPRRGVVPQYLTYALLAQKTRILELVSSAGSGTGVLDTGILKRLPIWLPNEREQERIVEVIHDAESASETLERLITKKQAVKQGMMQQLLSKTAGTAVRLADVTRRIGSGITPRGGSSVYQTSGRPFVRSQNVGRGDLRLADLAYIDEATHKTFPASEIRAGDVLLNITGASIGRSAVATPELDGGNVNQHVCEVRLDPQLMDPQWVNAVLNSRVGQDQIDAFQAGGNRQGLNFQQVGSICVPAPEISQQRANGLALGDIDTLIAALRRRLRKAQSIKQGMMQQLLTGRTRLPVFEGQP